VIAALTNFTDVGIHEPRGRKIGLALAAKGHAIHWVCAENKGKEQHSGITMHYLPIPKNLPFRLREALYILATPLWFAWNSKKLGIGATIGFSHPGGVAAWMAQKTSGVPYVFDYPDPIYSSDKHYEQMTFMSRPMWAVFKRLESAALKGARRVFTISDYFAKYLRRQYGVDNRRITVAANAPDERLFRPEVADRHLRRQYAGKRILVYAGKATEDYGVYSMLDAFADAAKRDPMLFLFLIVKTEDDRLDKKIRELDVRRRIRVFANVPYERVPTILAAADAAIYPYPPSAINNHALPNKLLEYLACGLPVLSTDLPAAREALGASGFFYRHGDTAGFSKAAARLFVGNGSRLRKKARTWMVGRYSWRRSIEDYEKELEESAA